jgi:hypothetical protein
VDPKFIGKRKFNLFLHQGKKKKKKTTTTTRKGKARGSPSLGRLFPG